MTTLQVRSREEVLREASLTLGYLAARLKYKPGWSFSLRAGLTGYQLWITLATINSQDGEPLTISHGIPMPAVEQDERRWRRWLLDQIIAVERHEACEFFEIDGWRPFFPDHEPGPGIYRVRELDALRTLGDVGQ